ncbi:pyrroline-5-carboxylate reductase family protein [Catenulispora sp. GP43]|uniref:pyrroline-5-carboxylate reductase family protein n=1 Tax=Catenulispora sp. GP43 TaxID=3156263 RepID=UPI0035177C54
MITVIGSEAPGRAVLSGLLGAGMSPGQVLVGVPDKNETIPDRHAAEDLAGSLGLRTAPVWNCADADLVLLAVPPEQVDQVVQHIKPKIDAGGVVISCVPGVPVAQIEGNLPGESAVVQVLPDEAVIAGRHGTCVVAPGTAAVPEDVARVKDLFATMADVVDRP